MDCGSYVRGQRLIYYAEILNGKYIIELVYLVNKMLDIPVIFELEI